MTDFSLCTLCERPLDDGRAIQSAMDGSGAHVDCLDEAERGREEESHDEGDE